MPADLLRRCLEEVLWSAALCHLVNHTFMRVNAGLSAQHIYQLSSPSSYIKSSEHAVSPSRSLCDFLLVRKCLRKVSRMSGPASKSAGKKQAYAVEHPVAHRSRPLTALDGRACSGCGAMSRAWSKIKMMIQS